MHYTKLLFSLPIVNLLDDLVKNSPETNLPKTTAELNEWKYWEDLRRHVTEIYVMIVQAASHLEYHHII